jgi:membrane protein YqaA with SNARE-associated domain
MASKASQFGLASIVLDAEPSPLELTVEQRSRLRLLAAVPILLALLSYVGQILTSTLVSDAPLVLLALNVTDPILLLVAHEATVTGFVIVGAIRLFAPDLFLHQLGLEFGPDTRADLEAELGPGNRISRAMDWMERWFPRIGWLLLFAIPGYPMCLLAGIARMNRFWFVVVNLAGTFTRLTLIWWVSSVFEGPIGTVVNFIGRYSLPFTAAMFGLVFWQASASQRRRSTE